MAEPDSLRNRVLEKLNAASWSLENHAAFVDGVWVPHESSTRRVSYPDGFRMRLADLEEASLWFRSRNVLIRAVLERFTDCSSLMDVGAGNGSVSAYLQQHGIDSVALEPGIPGATHCASRGVQVVIASHLEDLALPGGSVQTIGLFDVIEHLEDPNIFISEVHRVLNVGGTCLITVPAFQSLWSQADEHAGHFRRYTRRSLDAAMSTCGFESLFSSYCFAAALPLLFALRTVPYRRGRRLNDSQLEKSLERELAGHSRLARWVGAATTRLEASWMRLAPVPFGTSIIAAYRKN